MPRPLAVCLCALVGLCPLTPAAAQDATDPFEVRSVEQGHALRYASGGPTASGEPYNPERLTVAHASLPFGTLVRLENPRNGAAVTARVNDRLPEGEGLVRLSARAADQLGLPPRGAALVLRLDPDEVAYLEARVERLRRQAQAAEREATVPVQPALARSVSGYTVQVASFSERPRAMARVAELRGAWVHPVAVEGRTVYRVCYGIYPTVEAAAEGEGRLRERGVEGFVKALPE